MLTSSFSLGSSNWRKMMLFLINLHIFIVFIIKTFFILICFSRILSSSDLVAYSCHVQNIAKSFCSFLFFLNSYTVALLSILCCLMAERDFLRRFSSWIYSLVLSLNYFLRSLIFPLRRLNRYFAFLYNRNVLRCPAA